ncbi:MAG: NAD-dependent epimerase/dehydratase family protein, partial [Planctomycetota bacterium]
MKLDGKKALLTGAAGGIGQAIVARLQDDGATVTGADLTEAPADHFFTGDLMDPAIADNLPA